MAKRIKAYFIFVVALLLTLAAAYFFRDDPPPFSLRAGEKTILLEIADTEDKRIRGLSGRTSLPFETGLLFVYDQPGEHGIWMKEMAFSLDIFWLDEAYTVVDLEEAVAPETFPFVFLPEKPALYVLEMNAGSADIFDIKIGDRFDPEGKR